MKKSKLVLFALVASSLLLAACGPTATAGTCQEVSGGGYDCGGAEITVAVENAYLPFNYIDENTGEAGGWDYDAWNEICDRINCTPVFTEAAWEGMIQAVADGQYDAAADGITITAERDELVDFSIGYVAI